MIQTTNHLRKFLSKTRLGKFLKAPMDPVLSLSRSRLIVLGLFFCIGHLSFGLLWTYAYPQHYENMWARSAAALLAALILLTDPSEIKKNRLRSWYVVTTLLLIGPAYMVWMYFMNPDSSMWMATTCVTILLIYQILDWRLATAGLCAIAALLIPSLTLIGGISPNITPEGWMVLIFSWVIALIGGITTTNEHMYRLKSTLSAIGVMAHELRTPLASASLLSDGLRLGSDPLRMSHQLDAIIRGMNHQIDSQIVNAQLLNIAPGSDHIGARALVQNAIDTYPFKKESERSMIVLVTKKDFVFTGTTRLFTQSIQNLIKNSIHAIMKISGPIKNGDVQFEIDHDGPHGLIRIKDRGPGIPLRIQRSIFEPFYSTQGTFSSGLGLAFCQQVIESNHGQIRVESSSREEGSTFVIRMPRVSQHAEISATRPASLAS